MYISVDIAHKANLSRIFVVTFTTSVELLSELQEIHPYVINGLIDGLLDGC